MTVRPSRITHYLHSVRRVTHFSPMLIIYASIAAALIIAAAVGTPSSGCCATNNLSREAGAAVNGKAL